MSLFCTSFSCLPIFIAAGVALGLGLGGLINRPQMELGYKGLYVTIKSWKHNPYTHMGVGLCDSIYQCINGSCSSCVIVRSI